MIESIPGELCTTQRHMAAQLIRDALVPHTRQIGIEPDHNMIRTIAFAAGTARIAASRISKTIRRRFAETVPESIRQPWPPDYDFWIEAVQVEEPGVHEPKPRSGWVKEDRRKHLDDGKIAEANHILEHERFKEPHGSMRSRKTALIGEQDLMGLGDILDFNLCVGGG